MSDEPSLTELIAASGGGIFGLYPEVRRFYFERAVFSRRQDGSVYICGAGDDLPEWSVYIDPDSWASVVAAMSAEGEDGPRFLAARAFHGEDSYD